MKKSKRVIRQKVLSLLYDVLQDQYGIFYSRETFLSGELSLHDIDALLAFKSDSHLEELRNALDRLEDGSYGICISCKAHIRQDVLDRDPVQRICDRCEQKFFHAPSSVHYAAHVTT
ncbi:MAG: hypothetical protein ABI623_12535 [bacterium]